MLHFPRWKVISIVVTCLAGLLFSLPNMFAKEQVDTWPWPMPKAQIPLGLDLQGGAHLLMAMDSDRLKVEWTRTLREQARAALVNATPRISPELVSVVGSSVQVRLQKPEDMDAALRVLRLLSEETGSPVLGTNAPSLDVVRGEGGVITLTLTPAGIKKRLSDTANASIETINRRINALGTAESTVTRQGDDRVLIQFPGLQDTAELKDLLKGTAKLTFHDVHPTMSAEEAQQAGVPTGFKIYPSERDDGR